MDVNLTISLIRGQMGAVIEKAVNVAVETVLGEMIRVVGLKFEEIKREMTAKEKENQNIRKMLAMSRCQMKTMRKYISVVSTNDSNHRLYHGHQGGISSPAGLQCRRTPSSTMPVCSKPPKPRATEPSRVARPSWERQHMHLSQAQNIVQDHLRSESQTGDFHIEDIHGSSLHKADSSSHLLIDSQGLLLETSDPIWGQNHPCFLETGHTDIPDPSSLSTSTVTDNSELSQTTGTLPFGAPSFKIKQEEAEVEIVCVKDEHAEGASTSNKFEYSNPELQQQVLEPELGVPLDLPGSFQAHQSPGTSADLGNPAFSVDPTTYNDPQLSLAGVQKQGRSRRKDLNVYEEHKRSRADLRKRGTTRRRELEQMLPQALLADLVRERREKTRLRVARWRAKRRLQACLMATQAAQLNGAPVQGTLAQRGGLAPARRRGGVMAQQGGLGFRRGPSDTYNLLLQLGPSQSVQSHNLHEGQMQPGSTGSSRHKTPRTEST